MAYADVNGQRIYYEDSGGDGPPILLSHGFLMDHEMFAPQVEALSDDHRCITWDARGFGQTEFDDTPFTYWDLADDALGLLDHLGIDRAVLAGMSQGGYLSLRAALAHPHRVRALILIDTQAGLEDEQTRAGYQAMLDDWAVNGPANVGATVAGLIISDPDVEPAWLEKWRQAPPERIRQPGACLLGRDDITDRLGEIACPALVIHGSADQGITLDKGDALCKGLADCRDLVVVDGAAHASNLTHPEPVNEAIRQFLATLDH